MENKKARLLVSTSIDGVAYGCNQVVSFSADQAKALAKEGIVDTTAAAVNYCVNELGAKVVEHSVASESATESSDIETSPAAEINS